MCNNGYSTLTNACSRKRSDIAMFGRNKAKAIDPMVNVVEARKVLQRELLNADCFLNIAPTVFQRRRINSGIIAVAEVRSAVPADSAVNSDISRIVRAVVSDYGLYSCSYKDDTRNEWVVEIYFVKPVVEEPLTWQEIMDDIRLTFSKNG